MRLHRDFQDTNREESESASVAAEGKGKGEAIRQQDDRLRGERRRERGSEIVTRDPHSSDNRITHTHATRGAEDEREREIVRST